MRRLQERQSLTETLPLPIGPHPNRRSPDIGCDYEARTDQKGETGTAIFMSISNPGHPNNATSYLFYSQVLPRIWPRVRRLFFTEA